MHHVDDRSTSHGEAAHAVAASVLVVSAAAALGIVLGSNRASAAYTASVTGVTVDLAATAGGSTGDGAADQVVVDGTDGVDHITVSGSGTSAAVGGLVPYVSIRQAEFANDRLDVNTLGGADTVDSSGLDANVIQLYVDGVPQ
jgi:hypothetical protein